MKEIKAIVKNKVGLHARPAALFVQTAAKFKSDIKVSCQDQSEKKLRTANAKSILSISSSAETASFASLPMASTGHSRVLR